MDQIIVEMTSLATIAIAGFGVLFCLTQAESSYVKWSFAAFLTAVAVNNVTTGFARLIDALPGGYAERADLIIGMPSTLCLAPLFWIYVVRLTSAEPKRPAHVYRHLLLPALAAVAGLVALIMPDTVREALLSDGPVPASAPQLSLIVIIMLLHLAVYPQMALYLILIIRRLLRHRVKLRDIYASTQEHELRWIYVIGGLSTVFWLLNAVALVIAFDVPQKGGLSAMIMLASIAGLCLVTAATLWGIRQRPPLVPTEGDVDPSGTPDVPTLQKDTTAPQKNGEKYEKSALSAEATARIARKLRAAMETDHLHRDPNLSLWGLARHIGASPNYISQTLSEVIGESFFDFVNGYRIAEAMTLLSTTDRTVLKITYDAGFNTRSSFYNAFKRITGRTPMEYRKSVSLPAGMDDGQA